MKIIFTKLLCFSVISFLSVQAQGQQNFFRDVNESAMKKTGQKRTVVPEKFRTLQADTAALRQFLRTLPSEQNITDRNSTPVMEIPMPDGSIAKFHVWESSTMEKGLADAFPELKTFTGQGIDDRTATIKMDWTEFGFHAMIFSSVTGTVLIDPYDTKTITNYISYFKKDYKKKQPFQELPPMDGMEKNVSAGTSPDNVQATCVGTQLRTYRLAIACTHEYAIDATDLPTPTKAQTLAKVVASVNRVNGVFETEFSIRLVLIANDTVILFTTAASDPFTGNNSAPTLINESQTQINSRIGSANYDIGHTFSTGTAGYAGVGVVCVSGSKARGVTGISNPVGDAYDIDYVSHEIGHQFGASHTFNNASGCGVASADQNAEPGSGVTIMGYAGVCANDNLANNSIPNFHAVSFDKIMANSTVASCAVVTATGNSAPVVNAGADYTIPKSTFFVLTGSATDANGDALTYGWEQIDVGGPNGLSTLPFGNDPLFRSDTPKAASFVRYFPKLSSQVSNTTPIGELLPSYARTMKFRLTARDNRAGGGGICSDENLITVASSGPFTVTYPTSAVIWYVNDFKTITWDVNGTNAAPVSCANVTIQLSTDGGYTFPVTLIASTPNDGSEEIQVPNNLGSQCRIRVMSVGNIFYDISNSNFTISNSPSSTFVFNNQPPVAICAGSSGTTTLKTGGLNGFSTSITLSASLNPAGTTVSFGTTTLSPGASTTFTLGNTSGLAAGAYTVRVTGTAGATTVNKDIIFLVGVPAAPASLTAPASDAIGQVLLTSFNWAAVSGAASYTLEISTASNFSSLAQSISGIKTLPYILTTPLLENTIYYWRVKTVTACGESVYTTANRFKTLLTTCKPSYNVPVDITASGTPTATSSIVIPASAGVVITDLNITGITGKHAFVSDLTFTLTGPNATSVVLMADACNGGYQNFAITFDDQASSSTIPCPPTGNAVRIPANPLSVFNGINSAGTWTLTINDNVAGDGGVLTAWGLNINSTSTSGCVTSSTPLAGTTYTFTGNGNWNVASNWSSNTIPPSPLPSGAAIVINHAAGGVCTLNVSQTISAGATLTVMTGKNLVVPGTLTIQ